MLQNTLNDLMLMHVIIMFQTGLLSAEDIDKVCTDGLGLRYAFIGPLETMHLNANGKKIL